MELFCKAGARNENKLIVRFSEKIFVPLHGVLIMGYGYE